MSYISLVYYSYTVSSVPFGQRECGQSAATPQPSHMIAFQTKSESVISIDAVLPPTM